MEQSTKLGWLLVNRPLIPITVAKAKLMYHGRSFSGFPHARGAPSPAATDPSVLDAADYCPRSSAPLKPEESCPVRSISCICLGPVDALPLPPAKSPTGFSGVLRLPVNL